jgi:predicted lipoprotein with Yx(FWY)xxD motif
LCVYMEEVSTIEGSPMSHPQKSDRSRQRPLSAALVAAIVAGAAIFAVTGVALANSFTLGTAKNVKVTNATNRKQAAKTEGITVNSRGVAVYELLPETIHHPLCTSTQCLQFWPPVTVASAKTNLTAAPGVKGKLGIWHRHGFFQVTLGAHPLYTFSVDKNKTGIAMGDLVKGFGGTWHVLPAGSSSKAKQAPTPAPPMTSGLPTPY